MADRAPERPETDRELLLLTVERLGHVTAHLAELTDKVGIQNGRLSKVEGFAEEMKKAKLPTKVRAIEDWQIRMILVVSGITAAMPFLIYEVRQYVLEKLGFVVGG